MCLEVAMAMSKTASVMLLAGLGETVVLTLIVLAVSQQSGINNTVVKVHSWT